MRKRFLFMALLGVGLLFTNCIITTRSSAPRATVYHDDPPPRTHATVTVRTPPVIVVDDDPEMVVIPGTYVYWLDGHDDVYFYNGHWWRAWDNGWYRSDMYSGGWVLVEMNYVPQTVRHLPSGWRQRHYEAPRVRWHETRNSWQTWEHDKYWEKRKWKKEPPPRGRR